jgi:hypothetical protein
VLSDISGNDIKAHGGQPKSLVRQLRNWLVENLRPDLPSGTRVREALNEFFASLDRKLETKNFKDEDLNGMSITEFIYFIHLLCKPAVS